MRTPYRFTLLSGLGTYCALLCLAVVLFRERMLFSDMAFQSFHIIRTGDLQVQSGRFGAVGTQFFPWVAQGLGLPLRGVLLSYSLGHVLYYFLLFAWVMLVLRQWRWGLVLLLSSVLLTTHTFFWLSEAPQGLAFLVAVLAWMDSQTTLRSIRWWQWPLFLLAMVTAFYFHPMVLYAMTFACVWLFFGQKDREKRKIWAAGLGLFVVLFVVKFKILPLDWYDAMSLSRAGAFVELWPHWLDIKSNRDFVEWLWRDYYLLPAVYAISLGLLARQRQWLLFTWTLLFPLGYILLVNIPFHRGDNQFYLENLYLPLGLMVLLPLTQLFDTIPGRIEVIFAVIGLAILLRLGHIYNTRAPWTARLHWLEQLVQQHRGPKTLINENDLPKDLLRFTWGIPYETLLLTSLPGPDSSRLFFQTPEITPKLDSLAQQPHLFLGTFKHYRLETLPPRYFKPNPSVGYFFSEK